MAKARRTRDDRQGIPMIFYEYSASATAQPAQLSGPEIEGVTHVKREDHDDQGHQLFGSFDDKDEDDEVVVIADDGMNLDQPRDGTVHDELNTACMAQPSSSKATLFDPVQQRMKTHLPQSLIPVE